MIELENVSKKFGDFEAVRSISLKADSSSGITALLGPNGAGKSTTMRLMTGYLRPTEGRVTVGGIPLDSDASRTLAKKKIGYLPESAPLYPEMLVSEFLEFSAKVRGIRGGGAVSKRIQQMTEELDLSSHFYAPIGSLSKGFRQRTALAATLIHDPEIIILDEPTSGLDPNQITHIRSIIRNLGKSRTLILSTHILKEVEDIADRVVIINKGRIAADRRTGEALSGTAVRVSVRAENALETLRNFPSAESCEPAGEADASGFQEFTCRLTRDCPEELFRYICSKGMDAKSFRITAPSLEDIFRSVTES